MKEAFYLLFLMLTTLAKLNRSDDRHPLQTKPRQQRAVMDQYTRRIIGFAAHAGNIFVLTLQPYIEIRASKK